MPRDISCFALSWLSLGISARRSTNAVRRSAKLTSTQTMRETYDMPWAGVFGNCGSPAKGYTLLEPPRRSKSPCRRASRQIGDGVIVAYSSFRSLRLQISFGYCSAISSPIDMPCRHLAYAGFWSGSRRGDGSPSFLHVFGSGMFIPWNIFTPGFL